jgi:hypothetical protein
MTLRDCTLLALAYYKSGLLYRPAVWKAIHAFERSGLSFSFRQVSRDWASLRKKKSAQLTLNFDSSPEESEITLEFLDNGLVIVRQGSMEVIMLVEEAREQYPYLFEEVD